MLSGARRLRWLEHQTEAGPHDLGLLIQDQHVLFLEAAEHGSIKNSHNKGGPWGGQTWAQTPGSIIHSPQERRHVT